MLRFLVFVLAKKALLFKLGVFSIKIPKKNTGEYFPNLDMLTKLLAPKRKPGFQPPTIEVINDDKDADQSNVHEGKSDSDDDSICWETEQEMPSNDENVCKTM